jgi:DNA polymerase III delta subunit
MAAAARKKRAPDPGTTCREWCARASAGDLPKLLLVLPPTSGEEEAWFGDQILAAARAYGRTIPELDMLDLDCASPDFTPDMVDSFLASPSLFASRQALILGRASKALNRWPRLADALLDCAASDGGPEWIVVQVGSGTSKGAKKVAATRRKGVEKVRFRGLYADPPPWRPDPDASEAAIFVAAEAVPRKLQLHRGAAGLLVQLAGARPNDLVQALEHFVLLGMDSIGEEQVRQVVARSAEGTAFDFADAILSGNSGEALQLIRSLDAIDMRTWDGKRLAAREAFGMIVSTVIRERAKTALVRAAVDQGKSLEEGLKAAGARPSMPVVRRMEKRLACCNPEFLALVLECLVEAETNVKMAGWRNSSRALEYLAFRIFRRSQT